MTVDNEKAIRAIVKSHVESYASGFSDRHIQEYDDDEGTINKNRLMECQNNVSTLQSRNILKAFN